MTELEIVLSRLDNVERTNTRQWSATCPACFAPGLNVTQPGKRILFACPRGCAADDILDCLGFVDPRDSRYSHQQEDQW